MSETLPGSERRKRRAIGPHLAKIELDLQKQYEQEFGPAISMQAHEPGFSTAWAIVGLTRVVERGIIMIIQEIREFRRELNP